MPSNQTANYALNQWSKDDRVLMDDFNADNAKIDAALEEHAAALAALTTAAPKLGNCQIYTTSYTGTGVCGEANKNTLTFPRKPVWAAIFSPSGRSQFNIFPYDINYGIYTSTKDYFIYITWSGNTVSWYATEPSYQMNSKSYTYNVIAFWPMD